MTTATRTTLVSAIVAAALLAGCGADGGVTARRSDATESAPSAPSTDDAATPTSSLTPAPITIAPNAPTLPPVVQPATTVATIAVTAPAPTTPIAPPVTAAPSPTAPPAVDLVRFDTQTFVDPAANGVTAISVLVPSGWSANAGVQWLPYWSRLAFLQTHVDDPSTGLSIDWLPIQDFISFPVPAGFDVPAGGNYQGKAFVTPIRDPADFVQQFWVPNDLSNLAGAQLVSIVEEPAIAAQFVAGYGAAAEAHAYRMRYEYDVNGQPWEQDVSFALLFSGDDHLTSWYVNFAYTVKAPKGVIDAEAGLVSSVVASRISTPEWEANYRIVQRLFYQGLQQQMADTVAFGKLLAQYRAESQQLQAQVTAERYASQDQQAEVFRETLVGVQTYADPVNDGLVQLPNGYDDYWVNEQGEYLAVGPGGFDPNTLDDGTWQPLTPHAPST